MQTVQSNLICLSRTEPLSKMRTFDLNASAGFVVSARTQGNSTEKAQLRHHDSVNSSDPEFALENCGHGQDLADAELCKLIIMFCNGRNSPPLDNAECQSGGRELIRNEGCRDKLLPDSPPESECCTPLVPPPIRVVCSDPMPPPRRFYRGFWFSMVKRVMMNASGSEQSAA
jgi:hypothetical protein